jgi:hypothetical protein
VLRILGHPLQRGVQKKIFILHASSWTIWSNAKETSLWCTRPGANII